MSNTAEYRVLSKSSNLLHFDAPSLYSIKKYGNTQPTWHRNIEGIFRKYSIEILQYCNNIYKAVRKVSKILQEPCNVRSEHY